MGWGMRLLCLNCKLSVCHVKFSEGQLVAVYNQTRVTGFPLTSFLQL